MNRILTAAVFLFVLSCPFAYADDASASYVDLKDAPTITVDWSRGNTQAVTLRDNRTLIFSNGLKGGKYLLIVRQDGHGSRSVTWPSSVHWPGPEPVNAAPALTTTAEKKDYISFFCDGVTYDALAISQSH